MRVKAPRLVRMPGEQKQRTQHDLRHALHQRQRQRRGRGDAEHRADGDEARLLHAERARDQEAGRAHGLAEALDHHRVEIGHGITHQIERHQHFERAEEPDADVDQHGQQEARHVGIDAHQIVVQAGEIGERRPAGFFRGLHQRAVDELGAAEALRQKKPGERDAHDRYAGHHRADQRVVGAVHRKDADADQDEQKQRHHLHQHVDQHGRAGDARRRRRRRS